MITTDRLRYFAACNSENGFYSFYSRVFDETLERIYIIKGGPGTGKSSLMRRAADRAEQAGYRVEEIYCSSDPASLDGMIACDAKGRGKVAVLDGTAPHIRELELAGARDSIFYVGEFWSEEALTHQREAIAQDCRMRADAYRRLFRYLHAAGQCVRNAEDLVSDGLDMRGIGETITSILEEHPSGSAFEEKIMVTRSIGMKGSVRLSTLEKQASLIYQICDRGNLAWRLLDEIYTQAQKRRLFVWVSRDPLIPTRIDGICLPESGLAFVVGNADAASVSAIGNKEIRSISIEQYLNPACLARAAESLDRAENITEQLMHAAYSVLDEIRKIHFTLEKKYVDAMDFEGLNTHTERWLKKILP